MTMPNRHHWKRDSLQLAYWSLIAHVVIAVLLLGIFLAMVTGAWWGR